MSGGIVPVPIERSSTPDQTPLKLSCVKESLELRGDCWGGRGKFVSEGSVPVPGERSTTQDQTLLQLNCVQENEILDLLGVCCGGRGELAGPKA